MIDKLTVSSALVSLSILKFSLILSETTIVSFNEYPIGYSLNDTIVVSDRIRENFRIERDTSAEETVNLSINQTLGRTIITSFTTLLVLFALFIFGGELIRGL